LKVFPHLKQPKVLLTQISPGIFVYFSSSPGLAELLPSSQCCCCSTPEWSMLSWTSNASPVRWWI